MSEKVYQVHAVWDDEAKVWVAESDDVPGLITEAETVEALLVKLRVIIPDLLEENDGGDDMPDIPLSVIIRDRAIRAAQ